MNRNFLTMCGAAALSWALSLNQSLAAAEISAADADDGLSEVIVTARRSEERSQDVPISMTVFDQKQLAERNIVTAGDLAAFTPSLAVDNQFGQDVTSFSIRGFVQALNTTPSVAVYFGEAVVPRGGAVGEPAGSGAAPGSFFDLQNVQVLKGPQGTLFGRNTDGGAVLLVPQKPKSVFEGYIEETRGNFDLNRIQAVLNVPVTDWLRVRLGVDRQEREGYMTNVSGIGPADFNNIDYTAARLSVVADITPNLENYTLAAYALSTNNGPLPQMFVCNPAAITSLVLPVCSGALAQVQAGGRYATTNDLPGALSHLNQVHVVNTTTWHANDELTLKNVFSYGQLVTSLDSALFGANFIYQGTPIFATTSNPTGAGAQTTDQYTYSDEVQAQGTAFSNELSWQAGAYFERSGPQGDPTGTRSANFVNCTNIANFECSGFGNVDQQMSTIHYSDIAGYAQVTYKLTRQLNLTGGFRETWDRTTSTFNSVNYTFGAPGEVTPACASLLTTIALNCVQQFEQNSHAPTYMVDLDYKPTDDLLLYAKYSRGYRQGGVAPFVADNFHTYGPEHVNSYEIGEKTTFRGPVRGTFNVSAFFNDFTDQQLLAGFVGTNLGTTPTSGIVNAGKSRIWGVEVESAITPIRPLTFGLNYTYLFTKLESFSPTASPGPGYAPPIYPSAVGGALPFSPKGKLSADATYRLPLPDSVGDVSVNAVYAYTTRTLVSASDPYAFLRPYGILNLNLSWVAPSSVPIEVDLFVTNVTNRLYYNNVTLLYTSPFGFDSRFPGDPRMYGARIRAKLGKN
jgi:iron complex outermembrane receptor protein